MKRSRLYKIIRHPIRFATLCACGASLAAMVGWDKLREIPGDVSGALNLADLVRNGPVVKH